MAYSTLDFDTSPESNLSRYLQSIRKFPMLEVDQIFREGGPTLMYFSSAALPDVLAFYRSELNKRGFEPTSELTDNATYAALTYLRDGGFYTMNIVPSLRSVT